MKLPKKMPTTKREVWDLLVKATREKPWNTEIIHMLCKLFNALEEGKKR